MEIFAPNAGVALTSGANVGNHVAWFRGFLAARKIAIAPVSPFGRSLRALDTFAQLVRGDMRQPALTNVERYELASQAMGADFMTKAFHRTISSTEVSLAKYWPLFARADANQLRAGGRSDSLRNEVWEALAGSLVANFASDVCKVEPDLHCTFLERKWGLACKALYSFDPDQQIKKVIEGVKQLEGATVDRGIVVINVANLFPHQAYFDLDFPNADTAINFVRQGQTAFMQRFRTKAVEARLTTEASGTRDKTRMVLFFCPTIVNVQRYPSLFCCVEGLHFRRVRDEEARFELSFRKAAATAIGHAPPLP